MTQDRGGILIGSQHIRWKKSWTPSQNNTELGALLLPSCLILGDSLNFSGLHFHLSNKRFELGQLFSKFKRRNMPSPPKKSYIRECK